MQRLHAPVVHDEYASVIDELKDVCRRRREGPLFDAIATTHSIEHHLPINLHDAIPLLKESPDQGNFALHIAAIYKRASIIEHLYRLQLNGTVKDLDWNEALIAFLQFGGRRYQVDDIVPSLRALIEAGADFEKVMAKIFSATEVTLVICMRV